MRTVGREERLLRFWSSRPIVVGGWGWEVGELEFGIGISFLGGLEISGVEVPIRDFLAGPDLLIGLDHRPGVNRLSRRLEPKLLITS